MASRSVAAAQHISTVRKLALSEQCQLVFCEVSPQLAVSILQNKKADLPYQKACDLQAKDYLVSLMHQS